MLTKSQVLKMIKQHACEFQAYGVKKLGVFGSFAKSLQNSRSDVDVLVEFDRDQKTFDNYMNLKFYLEKLFHRKVDLVIKDALKPRIKEQVLADVIYA